MRISAARKDTTTSVVSQDPTARQTHPHTAPPLSHPPALPQKGQNHQAVLVKRHRASAGQLIDVPPVSEPRTTQTAVNEATTTTPREEPDGRNAP